MTDVRNRLERRGASGPLIRKLSAAGCLTSGDHAVLDALCSSTRRVETRQDIIAQGEPPSDVHLILDGLAYRYKMMPDGQRQIVAVMVPGDFCDLHVAILGEMDHAIATLEPSIIVDIPVATIRDLTENHRRIARALWWATLVDEAILREWLVNLGQREAAERLSHFFCEMFMRMQLAGCTDGNSYTFPFRQYDLADLFGLTSVHVNRVIQHLRAAGLIILNRRQLEIPDIDQLKSFCGFDSAYLHLDQPVGMTVN